jgi:hypothetical protein
MSSLTYQRCFNHAHREAVALCPRCGQFFCRECITEHEERVICAACLRKLTPALLMQRRGFSSLLRLGHCALSLLAAWFFFYLLGESLLRLPTSFHEGTLWHVNWLDQK